MGKSFALGQIHPVVKVLIILVEATLKNHYILIFVCWFQNRSNTSYFASDIILSFPKFNFHITYFLLHLYTSPTSHTSPQCSMGNSSALLQHPGNGKRRRSSARVSSSWGKRRRHCFAMEIFDGTHPLGYKWYNHDIHGINSWGSRGYNFHGNIIRILPSGNPWRANGHPRTENHLSPCLTTAGYH